VLRRLLAERDPAQAPTESDLEDELVRLIRRAGLPEPVRQLWVEVPNGPRLRIDAAYPDQRIAIETNGRLGHASPADMQRDARKLTLLSRLGWRVLVFTWGDLTRRPAHVVGEIRAALDRTAALVGG
jgi:very-short-patch-repair endonuclease